MSQKTEQRLKNTVVIIQYTDTSIDLAFLMHPCSLSTAMMVVLFEIAIGLFGHTHSAALCKTSCTLATFEFWWVGGKSSVEKTVFRMITPCSQQSIAEHAVVLLSVCVVASPQSKSSKRLQ
jgi:hypothetical protein